MAAAARALSLIGMCDSHRFHGNSVKPQPIAAALELLRSAPAENNPLEFIFGDLLDSFTTNETKVLAALAHFTSAMEVKFIAELAGINQAAAQGALSDLSSRALVLHEAPQTGGFGAEIAATIGREAFEWLDAPVARLGALDTPIPFSKALEEIFSPKGRLVPALRELVQY